MGKVPLMLRLSAQEAEDVRKRTIQLLENVRQEQRSVLEDLLEKNGPCEYLQRYSVNGKLDYQTFMDRVPLIKYAHIEQEIHKTARTKDKSNILTCDEIKRFNLSSGTTAGKPKLLPTTATAANSLDLFWKTVEAWLQQTQVYQEASPDGLGLNFLFHGTLYITPGGHELSEATAHYARGPHSVYRHSPSHFASPIEVILCKDYHQSLYCQLLCGLLQSSRVVTMSSSLITMLATAMAFLKEHWLELCKDIETGTLSERITDPSARQAVSKILNTPDPELANRIRNECRKESWAGIMIRLWPNLSYICCACTGALLQYVQHFEFFTENKVKIMSTAYACSEGVFAFNPSPETHPKDVTYVFLPNRGFFEFLSRKDGTLIQLADVEEGEEYEMVCTNTSGLWRYRMGDILKCVGHFHSSPEFQFVGRDNLLISVAHELVYEFEITNAVESAARLQLLPVARLVDYTTTVNVKEIPGHYVVFWEVEIQHDKATTEAESPETLHNHLEEFVGAMLFSN